MVARQLLAVLVLPLSDSRPSICHSPFKAPFSFSYASNHVLSAGCQTKFFSTSGNLVSVNASFSSHSSLIDGWKYAAFVARSTFSERAAAGCNETGAGPNKVGSIRLASDEALEDVFLPPGVDFGAKGLRRLGWSNVFVRPNAGKALIKEADFIKSSTKESDCPKDGFPEFALVGRSNVGKSSLVNALVGRKKLAKTSKTPGKTQVINHFLINKHWYLVDLPGYGYAKAPTNFRIEWDAFTKDYFLQRKTLVSALLLVDASLPPKQVDLSYAIWLNSSKIPLTIVFTKCDKRRKKKGGRSEENVRDFNKQLKCYFNSMPPWIMTSCKTRLGTNELLIHLDELRSYWRS